MGEAESADVITISWVSCLPIGWLSVTKSYLAKWRVGGNVHVLDLTLDKGGKRRRGEKGGGGLEA